MADHQWFEEMLVFYSTDQLDAEARCEMEKHLSSCSVCQQDLKMWKLVAGEIAAGNPEVKTSPTLVDQALSAAAAPSLFRKAFLRTINLLRAQVYLVRREMWPASAILMLLGVVMTILVDRLEVLRFVAPMIAAASLAAMFGPEQDPAWEVTCATATSRWKVLLARMTVVHGYNLILAILASLVMLFIIPANMLGSLILEWLGPLTFLSALALLLSLWIGTGNSIAVAYGIWVIQYPRFDTLFSGPVARVATSVLKNYREFWDKPVLLISLGLAIFLIALCTTSRSTKWYVEKHIQSF